MGSETARMVPAERVTLRAVLSYFVDKARSLILSMAPVLIGR